MVRRILVVAVIPFVFTASLGYFPLTPSSDFCNTIFTVIGIFYSIGYGIVLNFDYSKLKNDELTNRIQKEVNHVGNFFHLYFLLALAFFSVLTYLLRQDGVVLGVLRYGNFVFSFPLFFTISMLLILLSLLYNFKQLQNLKENLNNKIRQDSKS